MKLLSVFLIGMSLLISQANAQPSKIDLLRNWLYGQENPDENLNTAFNALFTDGCKDNPPFKAKLKIQLTILRIIYLNYQRQLNTLTLMAAEDIDAQARARSVIDAIDNFQENEEENQKALSDAIAFLQTNLRDIVEETRSSYSKVSPLVKETLSLIEALNRDIQSKISDIQHIRAREAAILPTQEDVQPAPFTTWSTTQPQQPPSIPFYFGGGNRPSGDFNSRQ